MLRDYWREVAYNFVGPAMESLTSADAFYRSMREGGTNVTRDVAREVWREYGQATGYAALISRMEPGDTIPRAWITERETKIDGNYIAQVEVRGVNPETQKEETHALTVVSANRLSLTEITEEAETLRGRYNIGGNLSGLTIGLTALYHRAGTAW
jgi:hypothetical protein